MEMEMEVGEEVGVVALVARLTAAAGMLEEAADRLAGREIDLEASFGRVAAREASREADLERKLAEANATIASLKAARKTLPAGVATLLAKDGGSADLGSLDVALSSLSVEQRIAVKSQLLRSGLIG